MTGTRTAPRAAQHGCARLELITPDKWRPPTASTPSAPSYGATHVATLVPSAGGGNLPLQVPGGTEKNLVSDEACGIDHQIPQKNCGEVRAQLCRRFPQLHICAFTYGLCMIIVTCSPSLQFSVLFFWCEPSVQSPALHMLSSSFSRARHSCARTSPQFFCGI